MFLPHEDEQDCVTGQKEASVGLGLHCMLGLRSAVLNKPRATVSVKMVGTLWGLLVPSMLVYKI